MSNPLIPPIQAWRVYYHAAPFTPNADPIYIYQSTNRVYAEFAASCAASGLKIAYPAELEILDHIDSGTPLVEMKDVINGQVVGRFTVEVVDGTKERLREVYEKEKKARINEEEKRQGGESGVFPEGVLERQI